MKRVILLYIAILFASLSGAVAAQYRVADVPNVQLSNRYQFVSNPDGILSAATVARIDSICYALKVSNIAQVSVVVVDQIVEDGSSRAADPFNFAYKLFSDWGVGRAGRDNGIGILFIEDQRQIRFVTGRGVEGVLPDAICKRIQSQYMIPAFRSGDYDMGMLNGVRVIESLLIQSELNAGGSDYYPAAGSIRGGGLPISFILLIMFMTIGLPFIISIVSYLRNAKCPRCGKYGYHSTKERVTGRGDNFELVEHTFRCPHCSHQELRTVRRLRSDINQTIIDGTIIGGAYGATRGFRVGGFGGRGFGGGGFGGGGFGGGFGGGGFGGGGAGSGW